MRTDLSQEAEDDRMKILSGELPSRPTVYLWIGRYQKLEELTNNLLAALRDAPMPPRESTLTDEEWIERYGEWWHEHASEAALAKDTQ